MFHNDLFLNPILPVPLVTALSVLALVCFVVSMVMRARKPREILFSSLRVFLLLAFACTVNLRIMRAGNEADIETRNIDVLFVVDTTISMWAQDYAGKSERMEGAKADCMYIMQQLAGANFGLIRFDNRAQILAPFTQDTRNVTDAFDTIRSPDRDYARGSDLSAPYAAMEDLLRSSESKQDRKTVVFFLSDGEITNDATLIPYAGLAHYIDEGAVLGYGTTTGGKMRESTYSEYVADPETGTAAISRINEANLRQIASDLGISYIKMEESSLVDPRISYIRLMAKTTVSGAKIETFDDTYFYFVIPLLLLLVVELIRQIFFRKL